MLFMLRAFLLPLCILAACAAPAEEAAPAELAEEAEPAEEAASAEEAEPAKRLVGRWEFRGPIPCDGTVLELRADGTAVLTPNMEIKDFDYRLDGNQLVLTVHDQSCAPPVVIYEVRFDGAALVQR